MRAPLPTYVLITPARNEAAFIEQTAQSMIAQTVLPLKWVIVSDGSTDGTDEIVMKYAAGRPWIELVRMPERRIDLILWFAEWKGGTDEEMVSRLAPYVVDFDENSRFAAINGMAGRKAELSAPPLIAALLRPEEESGRIKRAIVEVLVKAKAPLGDQAKAVAAALGLTLDVVEQVA